MLNQFAVDIPTLPVNQCLSHHIQYLEECSAFLKEGRAAEKGRQAFGTHKVYQETFLQIQLRPLQNLIRRTRIHGVLAYQNQFTHQRRRRTRTKHQFWIRDASPDRQPTNSVILGGGDSSKKYGADQQRRSRNFTLTNSQHQHLLVGR